MYDLSAEFDSLSDVLISLGVEEDKVERVITFILHDIAENLRAMKM